ncbi:MAG: CHC2 zinc finger domain-containing protein [Promethearchaeota archaeon]
MKISKGTIEKIKKNVSVKEVIGQYTEIKRGNKAICPLHGDNDPSLQIYEDTNSWYCFGCNKGGDVIKFIELVEGMSFKDVIQRLAQNNNIELSYSSSSIYSSEDFIKIIREIKDMEYDEVFNENILEKYDNKHRYVLDLGFKEETMDKFEIGYCADMNDPLFNRITIPWRNSSGKLVGIVGRDVTNKSKTKYIAKRGSKKGKHLYNLNNAKEYDEIIVVEDEKSVWRLWEFGYPNAIALGNSDLSDRKWLLRTHVDTIILCLDNDESGLKARNKIIQDAYSLFDIYVIKLPDEYKDIAEIKNKEVFEKCYNDKTEVVR